MSFIRKIINSATQKHSNTGKGFDMAKVSKTKKTTKKATAKKKTTGTASRKKVTKKSNVKKVTAKKTATKKSPAKKKAAPKKTVTKKAAAKKKPNAKKAASKKAVIKKTSVKKKTSTKKTAAKKTPVKKKLSAKKTSPKKKVEAKQSNATANKKPTSKKVTSKRQAIVATAKIPRKGNAADGPVVTPYQARKGENYMNKDQISHFVEILSNWKMELMQEVDRTVHHMKDESHNLPDPSDRASQEEEFSLELRTRDRERKLIRKIDKTLDAIKNDDFGYCEDCGIEIGVRRLEARPTATKCIDCKTLSELKERQTSL